ncbi:MAG: beta-ketoacyl-[acyl-carrier-protein] synthase family protein [Candidatus Omnitrophota bacterium]
MADDCIVITGLGIIASNGIGKAMFSDALFAGVSGIKPISLFDTSSFKTKTAGEITNFSAQDILGPKGLRTLDRSTKLAMSAAKLALDDAKLEINSNNCLQAGVSLGTALGSVSSICDFDKEALVEGPYYVNPALFPNTVINSPASQISIRFNIKGFNSTISTGFCAGLDALRYGADMLRSGKAEIVLAGGVEELCVQSYLGLYKTGCLSGSKEGSLELCCPFDKRRNGIVFGEASAVLVLENRESALSRGAKIYARIAGSAMGFGKLKRSMQLAIDNAGLRPDNIDCIYCAANSSVFVDRMENEAIKEVFADSAKSVSISAVKSMTGECYSAGAAVQAIAAVLAIERQTISPTINYQEKDDSCGLDYVPNSSRSRQVKNVLISALDPSGGNSALVISRLND